jgi:hypothetical protein
MALLSKCQKKKQKQKKKKQQKKNNALAMKGDAGLPL